MSLSPEARRQNMANALTLMLNQVGDNAIEASFIQSEGQPYNAVEATTWKELIDKFLIRNITWRTAMMLNNRHEEPEFKRKLGILSAFLKDSVKGRHHPGLLGVHAIAIGTSLDWRFIRNVLRAEMLEYVFHMKGAQMSSDGVVVTVPIDYGLPPI